MQYCCYYHHTLFYFILSHLYIELTCNSDTHPLLYVTSQESAWVSPIWFTYVSGRWLMPHLFTTRRSTRLVDWVTISVLFNVVMESSFQFLWWYFQRPRARLVEISLSILVLNEGGGGMTASDTASCVGAVVQAIQLYL